MKETLDEALSVHLPTDKDKCVILFINNFAGMPRIGFKWRYQALQMRDAPLKSLPPLTCLVAVVAERDKVSGVVEVMNQIVRGIVVYLGSEEIFTSQLGYFSKPIVWPRIKSSNNVTRSLEC